MRRVGQRPIVVIMLVLVVFVVMTFVIVTFVVVVMIMIMTMAGRGETQGDPSKTLGPTRITFEFVVVMFVAVVMVMMALVVVSVGGMSAVTVLVFDGILNESKNGDTECGKHRQSADPSPAPILDDTT